MRRKTRLEYHRAVKYVCKNEKKLRSESLAKKMCSGNGRNFWREIKLMRGKGANKLPQYVDNVYGEGNIAELFANKFKGIFISVNYDNS